MAVSPAGSGIPSAAQALGENLSIRVSGEGYSVADRQALTEYKIAITENDAEIAEAEHNNDRERVAILKEQREALLTEVRRITDKYGRLRLVGTIEAKARNTVRKAIRSAIARIREDDPALAQHLTESVLTGGGFVYAPTQTVPWSFDEPSTGSSLA
jgi:hypothetical protein